MLAGCTPWPQDVAQRYRDLGYWQGITLTDLLAQAIRRAPDKTALVHGSERIAYRALGEAVDRLACGFVDAGIRPLDRVVVQLPNIPEFVYTYFALARIGAIPVTALRAHRHTEVGHFLRASGAVGVRHPRRDQGLRLPGDGGGARAEGAGIARRFRRRRAGTRPARSVEAARDTGGRGRAFGPACGPGRGHDDAAVGRNDVAVEAHSPHARRLRAECAALRRGRRVRRGHRADGDPAARAQLQSGLAGNAGRVLLRGHRRACAVGRGRRGVRPRRARARDDDRRRGAVDIGLARLRRAGPFRPVVAPGDPERRRPPRARAAQPPARALRLHAAGDLRHRRRADQHDAARRFRRPAARELGHAGVRRRRDHRRRRRRPRGRRRCSRASC